MGIDPPKHREAVVERGQDLGKILFDGLDAARECVDQGLPITPAILSSTTGISGAGHRVRWMPWKLL